MANYLVVTPDAAPYLRILDGDAGYAEVSGVPDPGSFVNGAAFSPDGSRLAVMHQGAGMLLVLDTSDWSVVPGTPVPAAGTGFDCEWSPDGAYLAVTFNAAPGYRVYNATTWAAVSGLPTITGAGRGVDWSPDGAYLALTHGSSSPFQLTVIETTGWTKVTGTPAILGVPRVLRFSPDGTMLAVAEGPVVIDTSDWSIIPGTPSIDYGYGVAWRGDGSRLGMVTQASRFLEFDPGDWSIVGGVDPLPAGSYPRLAYNQDDSHAAVSSLSSPGLRVYSTADFSAVSVPTTYNYGWAVAYTPGLGATVYTAELPIQMTVVLPEALELPLSVTVTTPEYLELPIELTVVRESYTAELPLALTVYDPYVSELPISLAVIDGAVEGGLDGAAGWTAAPDGKWRPVVVLDGADISARVNGAVKVVHARNAAAIAELSFLPDSVVAPMSLIGRPVRIAFSQAGGANAQTMFTGVVSVPSVDPQTGAISLTCHDQAQERWSAMPRDTIAAMVGGRWRQEVSGEPADHFDYLSERIRSVAASWAIDPLGTLRILPWRDDAKTITVRQADVVDLSISLDLPSRDQLRTRVICRMQYSYPVFRARGAALQFAQPLSFFLPDSTPTQERPARDFLTVAMIEGALGGISPWELSAPAEIEHPPSGAILLDGTTLDPDAVFLISPQVAQELAIGVRARIETRWQQQVVEDYTLEVVWSALETQIGGPVEETIGANLEAEFDQPDWGSDPSIEPILPSPGLGDVAVAWQPDGFTAADRDEVLRTLADIAWIRLFEASRSGRARFSIPCRPDLWLDTRMSVIADTVSATGDVEEVEHVIDPESGHAVSHFTLAVGMPGDADAAHPSWTLPTPPASDYVPPDSAYSVVCGTFVGGDATSAPFDEETMIGFATNTTGPEIDGRNYYPHKLTIDAPGLAAEDRDPLTLPASSTITVDVPTDLLEIT